jgi:hypothetical protein
VTLPSPSFYHSLTLDDIFQVWWGGRPVAHGHHWRSSPQKSPRSELDITSGLHIYNALPSHFFSVVTLLLCDTASQCCARGRYLIYKAGRRRSGEGMGIRMVSGGEGGPDGAREVRRHALSLCCGQSHCSCFCVLCTTVTSPPRPRSSHGHHHDHDDHTVTAVYTVPRARYIMRIQCIQCGNGRGCPAHHHNPALTALQCHAIVHVPIVRAPSAAHRRTNRLLVYR